MTDLMTDVVIGVLLITQAGSLVGIFLLSKGVQINGEWIGRLKKDGSNLEDRVVRFASMLDEKIANLDLDRLQGFKQELSDLKTLVHSELRDAAQITGLRCVGDEALRQTLGEILEKLDRIK